jgi:hypothetical protein
MSTSRRRPYPPHPQDRVDRRYDGALFEPVELLERLAALTPGLGSTSWFTTACSLPSRWRARAVAYGRDTLAPPRDPTTRVLLERILAQEEEHADDMHDLLVTHEGRPMLDTR